MPEAARALGRTQICLRKWIKDGIIPPPVYKDTTKGYMHYSVGELTVIAQGLAQHERSYSYLTVKHTSTIHRIWESMRAFRARII